MTEHEKMLLLADRLATPLMNKRKHEERMLNGDERDMIVAALRSHAQGAPTDDQVETACAAYAKATGYYVEFHRGLSSESSDRMRTGMRAALSALTSTECGESK